MHLSRHLAALCVAATAALSANSTSDCVARNAVAASCKSKESAITRDYFYIGGEYVYEAAYKSSIYSDQIYVEKLQSAHGTTQPHPLILITAGVPTGAGWLNTPDNREGWASYFTSRGYLVYIVDITGNGRSTQEDIARYSIKLASTVTITEDDYTAPQLIDPYPQSVNHTQWPGNGTQGDPIFDEFMASMVPLSSNATAVELSMRYSACTLLKMIGEKSYLISHSAGATYATLLTDQCPDLISGSINLEPGNTPFQNLVGNSTVPAVGYSAARPCGLTTTMLDYDPPISNCTTDLHTVVVGPDTPGNRSCYLQNPNMTIHTLPNVAKVPYVALTGSASPHITYDHCTITFLKQAGVDAEWIKLSELDILGNGHFLYLEKNNLQIAGVVEGWIERTNRKSEGKWTASWT